MTSHLSKSFVSHFKTDNNSFFERLWPVCTLILLASLLHPGVVHRRLPVLRWWCCAVWLRLAEILSSSLWEMKAIVCPDSRTLLHPDWDTDKTIKIIKTLDSTKYMSHLCMLNKCWTRRVRPACLPRTPFTCHLDTDHSSPSGFHEHSPGFAVKAAGRSADCHKPVNTHKRLYLHWFIHLDVMLETFPQLQSQQESKLDFTNEIEIWFKWSGAESVF